MNILINQIFNEFELASKLSRIERTLSKEESKIKGYYRKLNQDEDSISEWHDDANIFKSPVSAETLWYELECQYEQLYELIYFWRGQTITDYKIIDEKEAMRFLNEIRYYAVKSMNYCNQSRDDTIEAMLIIEKIIDELEILPFVYNIACIECWSLNIVKHGFQNVELKVNEIFPNKYKGYYSIEHTKHYKSQRFLCMDCSRPFPYEIYRRDIGEMIKSYILNCIGIPKYLIENALDISQTTVNKRLRDMDKALQKHNRNQVG